MLHLKNLYMFFKFAFFKIVSHFLAFFSCMLFDLLNEFSLLQNILLYLDLFPFLYLSILHWHTEPISATYCVLSSQTKLTQCANEFIGKCKNSKQKGRIENKANLYYKTHLCLLKVLH